MSGLEGGGGSCTSYNFNLIITFALMLVFFVGLFFGGSILLPLLDSGPCAKGIEVPCC